MQQLHARYFDIMCALKRAPASHPVTSAPPDASS